MNIIIFEKRGLVLKIYELVFKIKELTFQINGLIFKISGLIFKIMEIKSQIPNRDYLLTVYALNYNICHHILYMKLNAFTKAIMCNKTMAQWLKKNACISAPIRFSFVTFYTFQFLIQVLWF